jgi:SAM-dependent methyltransferase
MNTTDHPLTINHYTFGETDLAARRLSLLAAAYDQSSREFLAAWARPGVDHAIDLGCGPGHTTRLVQATIRPRRLTGLDASDKLLKQAIADVPEAAFVRHDVTRSPFPCEVADFLFCRFLLTHLHDPGAALRAWSDASLPGATLLIQETATLASDDPTFQRYYTLVGELQAGYGQALHIGAHLDGIVLGSGWKLTASELRVVEQDARVMARLHAMNIRTWGQDALARKLFDCDEITRVRDALAAVAAGERAAPPVRNALRQIVATPA